MYEPESTDSEYRPRAFAIVPFDVPRRRMFAATSGWRVKASRIVQQPTIRCSAKEVAHAQDLERKSMRKLEERKEVACNYSASRSADTCNGEMGCLRKPAPGRGEVQLFRY